MSLDNLLIRKLQDTEARYVALSQQIARQAHAPSGGGG